MSIQLTARVAALEGEVKDLRSTLDGLLAVIMERDSAKDHRNGPRQMCPKCNEKPNYHLHVINCKGPTKKVAAI